MGMADYQSQAIAAANANGVPPALFLGLVQQESNGDPYAISGAGAIGLTQLLPGTAAQLGVNAWDPVQNLNGGAAYLKSLFEQFGNWTDALGAYNAGPGAWANVKAGTATVPNETSDYLSKVAGYAQQFAASDPSLAVTTPSGQQVQSTGHAGTDFLNKLFGTSPLSGNFYNDPSTGKSVLPVQTGGINDPTGVVGIISKVFSPEFWQGALLDILAVGAILLLIFVGGSRIIKH